MKKLKSTPSHDFANKLISKGHKCIQILETRPVRVRWCGKEICEKALTTEIKK